jgi:hypothetical protein
MIVKIHAKYHHDPIVEVVEYMEGSGDPSDEHVVVGTIYVTQSGLKIRSGYAVESDHFDKLA